MNVLNVLGSTLTPKRVALGIMLGDMIGRPTITMTNKDMPLQTRKLMATREFLTELFGFGLTYSVATFVENTVPKMYAQKVMKMPAQDVTKHFIENIAKADFAKLAPNLQKFKGVILGCSFLGAILAASILTPILNNIVLNKIMNKIMGSEGGHGHGDHGHKGEKVKMPQTNSLAPQFGNGHGPVITSPSFEKFVQIYQKEHQPQLNTFV